MSQGPAWVRLVGACGIVLGVLAFTPKSIARQDYVPGSRYTSARGAGLGDSFIGLADDGPSSLFYNPAEIASRPEFEVEPMNIALKMNAHFLGMNGLNFFQFPNLQNYQAELAKNPGKYPKLGGHYFPSVSFRGFAMGLLLQGEQGAQQVGNEINYRTQYQLIPAVGTGFSLAQGILRFGYSLQWVHETVADQTIRTTDPNIGYTHYAREGSGFSHNVAFSVILPFRFLPEFNLVARNVGNLRFYGFSLLPLSQSTTNQGTPNSEPMTLDAAFNMIVKFAGRSHINFSFVARDFTNRSSTSPIMRAAFGAEFVFADSLFLRAGFGSGYPSFGFGLKSPTAEFGAAVFSEETTSTYHGFRDLKYMMQYQARVF